MTTPEVTRLAALGHLDALVAADAPQAAVFESVIAHVGELIGADAAAMFRVEAPSEVTCLGSWTKEGGYRMVAERCSCGPDTLVGQILESGRPARIGSYSDVEGTAGDFMREQGWRTSVGVPVVLEGRIWGLLAVSSITEDALPEDTEERLAKLSELVATAVSNAKRGEDLAVLVREQAALRRVATLVAGDASPAEVFEAVTAGAARVLDTEAVGMLRFERDGSAILVAQSQTPWDPPPLGTRFTLEGQNIIAELLRTGRTTRFDNWADSTGSVAAMATSFGIRSSVAAPIVVEGRLWGALIAATTASEPLPSDTERRIEEFTELIATAIAGAEARSARSGLAKEQAALRRVATLVAQEASQSEVFTAIAEELGHVMGVQDIRIVKYDAAPGAEGAAVVTASWGQIKDTLTVGERRPLGGHNVTTRVFRTGRPARLDDYSAASGPIAERVKKSGIRSAVGTPIMVDGRLWGAMIAAAVDGGPLPPDTESRLSKFTELMGTAIAKTEAHLDVVRLADEQAALRRVATLVAEAAPPAELFAKVAEEVAVLLGPHVDSAILRYEADGTATVVGVWGEQPEAGIRVGLRLPVDGTGVTARVHRERGPVRVDEYPAAEGAISERAQQHSLQSAVGCPILVEGGLWGAMVVGHNKPEPLPADTERRVMQFTALVATAIANTHARAEVQKLAEEQAALRRVATLVAGGAAPTELFDAVIVEVGQLLGAAQVGLARYENDHEISVLAIRGQRPELVRAGMRLPLDGDSINARILRTGRSARLNFSEQGSGTIAEVLRRDNVNATVGAPVVVDGALWGMIGASWKGDDRPPADAEERLVQFAELLDTAIANADSRDQLMASRARVLTAADDARRRVVRDLHDGAQQRLVHTIVTLKLARRALSEDTGRAASLLAEALDHAERGIAELRELSHGILPSLLTRGGLRPAIDALASRLDVPIDVHVTSARVPPEIEASAYFIVAEALTNVVKHAHATRAEVIAAVRNDVLTVEVRDDGIGGADPNGHGLVGISDRAAAFGGQLRIDSAPGAGTEVKAELPLPV